MCVYSPVTLRTRDYNNVGKGCIDAPSRTFINIVNNRPLYPKLFMLVDTLLRFNANLRSACFHCRL